MLELKKENVQMLRVKNKAVSQVTFDVDYNVPDAKADMGRIVQSKADVSMDEVRLSEGKAFLKGSLNADILYVSENEGRSAVFLLHFPWRNSESGRNPGRG